MGLNTLATILEKRGSEFVDKFLSEEVVITEKLDTYRILFEKQDDRLVFFKKDNTELNLIERTLTNVWEDAIIELTTIIGDTQLPENIRFGVAYTPVERPIRIPYSNLPKYILTDLTLRKNNKVVEVYDHEEATKWAAMLSMARPPVIFEGTLSEEQQDTIKSYGLKEFDKLKEKRFAKLVENLFEKSYSGEDLLEGVIIKSGKDLAQIISYEFDLLNESFEKGEHSRDFYDIILLKINSFMDSYSIPVLEGETSDEMYLEIVSDFFNKFIKKNQEILEDINPDFLTPPAYGYFGDLNLLLIKNKDTIKLLEKGGKIHEALYKVILSSLRKPKKQFGLLNETAAKKFNTLVYLIKDTIKDEIDVNDFVSTSETLNEARSENVVIDALNTRQASDVDNMRVISSIQKAFEPRMIEVQRGEKPCVIYLTECQPFTASQMENVYMINRTWKLPVILASISNERRIDGQKFHFSDELVKAQLDAVAIYNREIVPAFFMLEGWDLNEVFEYCRPQYEPMAVITDEGKKADLALQLYFEDEVMAGRINVEQEFNIGEIENKDKLVAFRAIEDHLYISFKDTTPQPIWGLFDTMSSEYKTWSGELIGGTRGFKGNDFL